MSHQRRVRYLIGTALACSAVVVILFLRPGLNQGVSISPKPKEEALSSELEREAQGPNHSRETLVTAAPSPPPEASSELFDERSDNDPRGGSRSAHSKLLTAAEETLYGTVDPSIFLDIALQLAELKPGPAIPEPHVTGAILYPLHGTPEGIEARLVVARTSTYANPVLGVEMQLDRPSSAYVVEGAVRMDPLAQVNLWRDKEGAVAAFALTTNLQPSNESRAMGLSVDTARIPFAFHYSLNVQTGQEVARVSEVNNGALEQRDVILSISSTEWPRWSALQNLNEALLRLYDSIRLQQDSQ